MTENRVRLKNKRGTVTEGCVEIGESWSPFADGGVEPHIVPKHPTKGIIAVIILLNYTAESVSKWGPT